MSTRDPQHLDPVEREDAESFDDDEMASVRAAEHELDRALFKAMVTGDAVRLRQQETQMLRTVAATDWRLCVRGYRDARGLSAVDVARRIGISRTHMWNIETGRQDPSVSVAVRLAAALDMELPELLGLRVRAALADEQRDTLDADDIAEALRAMDGANIRAEDDGYFNMAWREWPCSDIAAAVAARLKGEKP